MQLHPQQRRVALEPLANYLAKELDQQSAAIYGDSRLSGSPDSSYHDGAGK